VGTSAVYVTSISTGQATEGSAISLTAWDSEDGSVQWQHTWQNARQWLPLVATDDVLLLGIYMMSPPRSSPCVRLMGSNSGPSPMTVSKLRRVTV
jgi:hypothetical protein